MSQQSLFESTQENFESQPLASRLRPKNFSEILGQAHILGQNSALAKGVKTGFVPNLILWGPPGSGKTTLALSLAHEMKAHFIQLNAVDAGVKQIKEAAQDGRQRRLLENLKTLLFIDEIHRLNKGQQDVLLPHLESGDIVLIGATTENPSYELNRALLSRSQVLVLKALDQESLKALYNRALSTFNLAPEDLFAPDVEPALYHFADGDGRKLLNALESLYHIRQQQDSPLSLLQVQQILGRKSLAYDKNSEFHYDLVSAFIKSVRGSDPDAALYYMVRMLTGGEDPIFICRRLIILASEDIGNAEPKALPLAVAALQAVETVGLPEGEITLAHAVTYLASCPKSNRSYMALHKAKAFVEATGNLPVPLALRSSKTALAKDLNYGKGYLYPHDYPKSWVEQSYWPEGTKPQKFYEPTQNGSEKNLAEYQSWQKNNPTK